MLRSIAITAAAALSLTGALTTPTLAVGPSPGMDPLEWCLLSGGTEIPQPPGSSIQACCVEGEGCIICAADWTDCTYDPPYSRPGSQAQFPGADRLAPPSPGSQGGTNPLLVSPLLRAQ